MAQATWEKSKEAQTIPARSGMDRFKFLIGGILILAAVAYLIASGTATGARYFITIDELVSNAEYIGQTVRVSGAVIGDTIVYDDQALTLDFVVSHIPEDIDDLAQALHVAVSDPDAARLTVHVDNQVKPDLLQHEAQAILTGHLDENGVFHASELLLKCPSRYEEAVPEQADA
jgi:cytochrome c-type biogenesis protein CcmE